MYEELIRRLREEPLDSNKAALPIMDLCVDAATAIENLSHRLDMAQGERDAVTRHMIELEQDVCRLKSRLAAYEDLMERWKLRSIEEADRIFQRVNALGGTDLMAQYRALGSIDHLRDLLQAEQDGRLVVLPCKVGDTVYQIDAERVYESEVKWIIFDCDDIAFDERAIGGSIFLTREEAEAALKGGDSPENRAD